MPKLLHVLHSLNFSGAEVMLRVAAPTIHAQGIDQYLLSDGPVIGNYASTLQMSGFEIFHRPYSSWSILHLWRLYRFFKQHQFEIVHNHTEQNFFWYLLTARLAGVSCLLYTVHNAYQFRGQVRWRRGAYRLIARCLLGAKFIAIGPSVARVEASTYFNPTILVPNWLDEQHFVPARDVEEKLNARKHFGISKDATVIISVGGCSIIKNHGVILESLKVLQQRVSQPLVYLHVGDGSTHVAEQQQAHQLGIDSIVKFLGQLQDVRQALIAADIYVMPSLFEGLSISLLEALSCEIPSVVYDMHGLRDLVTDKQNGRCIPPNKEVFINALQDLINYPDQRQHYGKAGREFVRQHYSMHDSLTKLTRLYRGSTFIVEAEVAALPAE